MLSASFPTLTQAVEWRTGIWLPAVRSLLDRASARLRPGAEVLELGYGSGLMACHLAGEYGVRVTGFETDPAARDAARANAARFGLQDRVSFEAADPGQKPDLGPQFDIVFFKSFLYHVPTLQAYQDWLGFFARALRPGGLLLAAENGRGGRLDRFYRKRVRRARWSEFMLFDQARLQDFKQVFSRVDVQCFGHYSQFFSFAPTLCSRVLALEQRLFPPTPDHCFVAAILAEKAGLPD
jgi:cyclopropane fatty-acyl-phospholipid synthase-like methyltransferase